MAATDDIRKIAEQEATLAFESFDEATAFAVGSLVRDAGIAGELPIVVDVRTWDRPLFYAALPGSTDSNRNWARRKHNVVRMFLKSSYRMVLEKARPDRTFPVGEGLDPADYVLAGGGFPIIVKGAGVVGAICVSGLPERQDHEVIVGALCTYFGLDAAALALGPVES